VGAGLHRGRVSADHRSMATIGMDEFVAWLEAYGSAWRNGDAKAVVGLFTDDAQYFETPFGEPIRGRDAIFRYWSAGPGSSQSDVEVVLQPLAVVERTGIARWHATFVRRSGKQVELDGCLVAEFALPGKCAVFREWWHRRERGGGAPRSE
jgi:ketosteroid isomerase-like protein